MPSYLGPSFTAAGSGKEKDKQTTRQNEETVSEQVQAVVQVKMSTRIIIGICSLYANLSGYQLVFYLPSLFLSIRWLTCTWQFREAIWALWNTLLIKELISTMKMIMGYVYETIPVKIVDFETN